MDQGYNQGYNQTYSIFKIQTLDLFKHRENIHKYTAAFETAEKPGGNQEYQTILESKCKENFFSQRYFLRKKRRKQARHKQQMSKMMLTRSHNCKIDNPMLGICHSY